MIYVKFYALTGFCGTDAEEYWAFEKEQNEETFEEILNELIYETGDSYFDLERFGYVSDREEYDSEEEYEEAYAQAEALYWEDCTGNWSYTTREEWEDNNGKIWEND